MLNKKLIIILLLVFALGWAANNVYDDSIPLSQKPDSLRTAASLEMNFDYAKELPSPYDRVKEEQIHVYNDKVVIDLKEARWAKFVDTNSMDPLIDEGSNAIEITPKSHDEIKVGDIVSYESKYAEGTIIHRVVQTGEDENGWFARLKGDNNPTVDPGKVRFEQIKRVVVAVIY